MDKLQEIREQIEENSGIFSEGEYLRIMNLLLKISKKVTQEEEKEEGNYDGPFLDGELFFLYNTTDGNPSLGTETEMEVSEKINWFLQSIILINTPSAKLKILYCLFAYMFKNYQFLLLNREFSRASIRQLEVILDCDFFNSERKTVIKKWYDTLEKDFILDDRVSRLS